MEFPTVRALVAEVVDATVREPEQLLRENEGKVPTELMLTTLYQGP